MEGPVQTTAFPLYFPLPEEMQPLHTLCQMQPFPKHHIYFSPLYLYTVSPPFLWFPHPRIQQTIDQKYSEKKIPESSQKQNLNLPHRKLFTLYLQLFTEQYIVCGITGNQEMV